MEIAKKNGNTYVHFHQTLSQRQAWQRQRDQDEKVYKIDT
jgi:hypothetical protein